MQAKAPLKGGERRMVRLNGVPASSSADLGDIVQMTWLTPSMDRLFTEGANGRRRFIDRLVLGFDPARQPLSVKARVGYMPDQVGFYDELTARENLVAIATGAGLDRAEVEAWLDDKNARDRAGAEDQRAREIGIEGVPFFIFNGRVALSGAHPAETLLEAMRQAEATPPE